MKFLTKTDYCLAVRCPKMLWLERYRQDLKPEDTGDKAVMKTGTEVGRLARDLFGPHETVEYGAPARMAEETDALLKSGVPVVAEASFAHDGLFCSVDVLKVTGPGRVEIYEVKSSTAVREIHYHDAAFQTYVLTRLGLDVEKVCLVHIDRTYVRHGGLDLTGLFAVVDVTDRAKELLPDVENRIASLAPILESADEPARDLGLYCLKTTDQEQCGFFGYCARDLPSPCVFDLQDMQARTKLKHYYAGRTSFADLAGEKALSKGCRLQIEHALSDLPDHAEKEELRAFLGGLSYPLYFLDFESFQPAVPLYDDSAPYEQIPFQYSLHSLESKDAELRHEAFLAYPGKDPRRELAERLCRDIPADACTLAYNMGFEKSRIKRLAELYPDLREHLTGIHDNIADLMVPFRQKLYYTRAMEGSFSIKHVLPALFPDDPELDYTRLNVVHNGAEASDMFVKMQSMDKEELEENRRALLAYCRLDTYAMVKVLEKLKEAVE